MTSLINKEQKEQSGRMTSKKLRNLLSSSALVAAGMMAFSTAALADNSWANLTEVAGGFDTTTPNVNETNISLTTVDAVGRGDLDIAAGDTVNVNMSSSRGRFIAIDNEADPAYLLGRLNSNGQIWVLDSDGVFFGRNAVINVGGIVASTGQIMNPRAFAGGDNPVLSNFGNGRVVNRGQINVADAGLAAFVAPTVINNGVINARMGRVAMVGANGDTQVTLNTIDPYGDGLFEIAVGTTPGEVKVKNTGEIHAEDGGVVQIETATLEGLVDGMINMDGVVSVGSVTVEGGKIVLSAGPSGNVEVKGDLDARGTEGGEIDVTGENVTIADTAKLRVNSTDAGDAGSIRVVADTRAVFDGRAYALGGKNGGNGGLVEVSGQYILFTGMADLRARDAGYSAGTLYIDPAVLTLGGADNWNTLSSQTLANQLGLGHVALLADDLIEVGNDLDLSTYDVYRPSWNGSVEHLTGDTVNNLSLTASTVRFNNDVLMGEGNLNIDAATVGVNARLSGLYGGVSDLLDDSRITSTAGTVNIWSDDALIKQGIYLSNDAGGATVNVAAGEYHESVSVTNRDGLTLNGANAGVAGYNSRARGLETVIIPNSPGFYITSNNVTIDGFEIDGQGTSEVGIYVDSGDYATLKNNLIHDQFDVTGTGDQTGYPAKGDGIYVDHSTGTIIQANKLSGQNDDGIQAEYVSNLTVTGNAIDNADGDVGIVVMRGDDAGSILIARNKVENARRHGIMVYDLSGDSVTIRRNTVDNSKSSGIHVEDVRAETTVISNNDIKKSGGTGIYVDGVNNVGIVANTIHNSGINGIYVTDFGAGARIRGNEIHNSDMNGIFVEGNPLAMENVVRIVDNETHQSGANGVKVTDVNNVYVLDNKAHKSDENGISVGYSEDNRGSYVGVLRNDVKYAGEDGISAWNADRILANGNTVDQVDGIGIDLGRFLNAEAFFNTITDAGYDGIFADGYNDDDLGIVFTAGRNRVAGAGGTGIYVGYVDQANIGGNTISYVGNDGIAVENSGIVNIGGNVVNQTGDDGIEVVDSAYANIAYNNLSDIGNYFALPPKGVETKSLVIEIEGPEEDESGADAIHVENVYGYNNGADEYVYGPRTNVSITGNIINRTADDGIEVVGSGATLIAGNFITNAGIFGGGDYYGADAIHVRDVWANTEYDDVKVSKVAIVEDVEDEDHGEGHNGPGRSVTITGNFINKTADDGIEVLYSGPTRINENTIWNVGSLGYAEPTEPALMTTAVSEKGYYPENDGYGADAIHVREVSGYGNEGSSREKSSVSVESEGGSAHERGFPVEITGNNIAFTADDGIEVVDSTRTLIAENNILGAGFYNGGDIYGADGIHVRGVIVHGGNHNQGEEARSGPYGPFGNLYLGSHVEIRNNNVTNTGDDGIQVMWSGNTLIDGNNVFNTGLYGGTRLFGGDGIQVVTGLEGFGLYGQESKERYGANLMPVRVEVTGNTVVNAVDDGVQVVGANDVLVEGNTVNGSGDDGISILGFAGYANSDEIGNEPVLSVALSRKKPTLEWPEFNAVVVNNTVDSSAGDGAQIEGFDNILFAGNTVSNSGANGLYVSGPNNGYVTVSGNGFTDNDIGAQFESGTIDLTGEGNIFEGGRVGLRFAPYAFGEGEEEYYSELAYAMPSERDIYGMLYPYPFTTPSSGYAPLALVDDDGVDGFGGTIGAQSFDGQSEYFVELDNEAFFAPGEPTILNGLDSTYVTPLGTITPATTGGILTQAQYNYLEDMFFHYVDRDDLGLFFFGVAEEDALPEIDLEDILRGYGPFTAGANGINVTVMGLPTIPGGTAFSFANLAPFAGEELTPEQLASLTPAAGGEADPNAVADFLANVEPAAGGADQACWGDALANVGTGAVTNYSFGSGANEILADASRCQSGVF